MLRRTSAVWKKVRTMPEAMFVKRTKSPFDLPAEDDTITSAFIGIVCSDPDIDEGLGQLLSLFATEPPVVDRGYSHHDGYRTR